MGEDQRSRFFKIMMPGFEQRLKLPPAFCEKLKHEKSKRAILESCKGRWEMNVSRNDDDQIFFEDGWPRFAAVHRLSIKDFAMFVHTGKLHFNVVVYDKNTACEKQFVIDDHQVNQAYHAKRKAPLRKRSPTFSVEITPYSATKKGKVTIPKEFVKSNNLEHKRVAILRDVGRKRKWRVKIWVQNSPGFKLMMSGVGGWHDFVAANDLKVGDLCTFQLNTNSIASANISFDVQISRSTNR